MASPMDEYTGDREMESSLFTSLTLAYKQILMSHNNLAETDLQQQKHIC